MEMFRVLVGKKHGNVLKDIKYFFLLYSTTLTMYVHLSL